MDVELLPTPRFLIADHAAKVFCEVKYRRQHEFPQRLAEHAAAVRQRHRAFDQGRKQQAIQARGTRVNPLQVRRLRQQVLHQIALGAPTENHIGRGRRFTERLNRVALCHHGKRRHPVHQGRCRLFRIGYDKHVQLFSH